MAEPKLENVTDYRVLVLKVTMSFGLISGLLGFVQAWIATAIVTPAALSYVAYSPPMLALGLAISMGVGAVLGFASGLVGIALGFLAHKIGVSAGLEAGIVGGGVLLGSAALMMAMPFLFTPETAAVGVVVALASSISVGVLVNKKLNSASELQV